ncbi:hypothetical protein Tco_0958692, partial [Tanacetum coccineum]
DALIKFVNDLGYLKVIRHLYEVVTNDMFQPWRALTMIINLCLTGNTLGFERPTAPVWQILWGVINQTHIDYAERMREEFTQSIHTFIEYKKNLAQHTQGKKKATLIVILSVRSLQREQNGKSIPNELITDDIQGTQYYNAYLEKVAKHQRYLAGEEVSDPDSPTPKPAKVLKKRKPKSPLWLIDEFVDKGVPVNELVYGDEEADTQRAIEASLKEIHDAPRGPLPLVVIREPESRKFQPLPDVPGKGKEKRCTPAPTEPLVHEESSSLYAELGLTDSETDSDDEVSPKINPEAQDEGQAGPNLEHTDVEATNASNRPHPEQMDEGFIATAYPKVQENLKMTVEEQVIPEEPASSTRTLSSLQHLAKDLSFGDQFFNDKPSKADNEKTTADTEAESMVSVTIHQDTFAIPHMTSPVIDLTVTQPASTTVQAPIPSSTSTTSSITITTFIPPPLQQPQQSTIDPIVIQRIGDLEQHMANLIQDNLALEERLNKQGSRLYKLENLNISHQVSIAVDEIVTDAVDWAMQAPLRARFSDLPAVDMKEILQQWMFEDKSYEAHEDHKNLYEALQKSLDRDYSNQLLSDLEEACLKKRKRQDVQRTPSGSPPSHPPPLPPPEGASGAPGTSGASGSSQLPPPPSPPSTGTSGSAKQQRRKATNSSKTIATMPQSMAWTTSDTQYESVSISGAQELSPTNFLTHDDSIPNEQIHLSDDEDFENDHRPKPGSRNNWWKPLPAEERPANPEPAWTIPSSNVSDVENNWASALVSTCKPPTENSLLAKIGDMTTFINWYCQQMNKTELTQADFEGQAYEVVKAFYPDVINLQFQMEECHKMPTYQGSSPALSISKMKATNYPDFGLELLVPEQIHDSPSRRKEVRSHMQILSVIRIKAYSRYGYDYLSEIVLRRADFQEHTIAKKDFKNLHPSDFEDLYILLLQGNLDHLPGSNKRMLSTAVKLWTRNLVIRQRVEDFQLGIESYQIQLNLPKPGWDAKGYEFKHDYTIIKSPRAVVFPVDNNNRMMISFNEIYKFSNGRLTRILGALDKEFIAAIERRLKTRRIYRNLECFVGGRVRDIDYRLLQRTE